MIWVFFALFGDVSFCRSFRSWLRKNPLFVEKFSEAPDLPKHNKFWEIQKWFTKTFDSWLLPQFCWVCLICQIYITIGQRIVIAGSPPTIAIIVYCLIIHARMSSPFPHRATSSLNLPEHQMLAPPALPSLAGCRCRRCAAVAAAALPPRFPKRCHRVQSCASAKLPPPPPCWPPPPRCCCHRHRHRRCAATAPAVWCTRGWDTGLHP